MNSGQRQSVARCAPAHPGTHRCTLTGTGIRRAVFLTRMHRRFLILVAEFVLSLILVALPVLFRTGISTVVAGTLVAPFLALVVTLIYYRLSAAHGAARRLGSPAPATAWRSGGRARPGRVDGLGLGQAGIRLPVPPGGAGRRPSARPRA